MAKFNIDTGLNAFPTFSHMFDNLGKVKSVLSGVMGTLSTNETELKKTLSGIICATILANTELAGIDFGLFGGRRKIYLDIILSALWSPGVFLYKEQYTYGTLKQLSAMLFGGMERHKTILGAALGLELGLVHSVKRANLDDILDLSERVAAILANAKISKTSSGYKRAFLMESGRPKASETKPDTIFDLIKREVEGESDALDTANGVKRFEEKNQVGTYSKQCIENVRRQMSSGNPAIAVNASGIANIIYEYDSVNKSIKMWDPIGYKKVTKTESVFVSEFGTSFHMVYIRPVDDNTKYTNTDLQLGKDKVGKCNPTGSSTSSAAIIGSITKRTSSELILMTEFMNLYKNNIIDYDRGGGVTGLEYLLAGFYPGPTDCSRAPGGILRQMGYTGIPKVINTDWFMVNFPKNQIGVSQLESTDLVFFRNPDASERKNGIEYQHMAVYAGNGYLYNAWKSPNNHQRILLSTVRASHKSHNEDASYWRIHWNKISKFLP